MADGNQNGMENLIAIGETDARIFNIQLKLRRIPERLQEASRQLEAEKNLLDEVLIPWTELDHEINEREATIKIALDTIEKFEAHMKKVTTQKEYIAARKQVDEARRLNQRLQDEILERRIQQDELSPRLEERRETHRRVDEVYQSEESVILKEQVRLEKDIKSLTRGIEENLQKIGDNAFNFYQKLIQGNKMPAVVPVVAGSCNGCNMALPPQEYNLLLAGNGKLFTCPTCSRIIYPQPKVEAEPLPDAAAS